ncbi:MAG: YHS domain-containing (seleno)protein [Pseudomonadota bacterium]
MNTYRHFVFITFLSVLLVGCASSQSPLHRSVGSELPKNIGVHGYSPVSYFENNQAELGDKSHVYQYKNRVYYFTSAAQVETFEMNPEKYLPKFGDYCPYSLALGRRVGIDPTNFKVHDGELLLFHDRIELSTVDVDAQRDTFDKAEKEFTLLKF